jgi:hypothetical protein
MRERHCAEPAGARLTLLGSLRDKDRPEASEVHGERAAGWNFGGLGHGAGEHDPAGLDCQTAAAEMTVRDFQEGL